MNSLKFVRVAALFVGAAFSICGFGEARAQAILQSGAVTAGHLAVWCAVSPNGCVQDGGLPGGAGAPAGSLYSTQYNNSGAFAGVGPGTTGQVLTSNGVSSPASFQAATVGSAGAGLTLTSTTFSLDLTHANNWSATQAFPIGSLTNSELQNSAMTIGGQAISLGGATANQGNGAKLQLSTGSTTTNDLVKFDVNGNAVDSGISAVSAGTVTSVALSLPGIITVSGSPVTTTGTLTGTLATQAANSVWAGPATSGASAAAPTFRALGTADVSLPLRVVTAAGAITGVVTDGVVVVNKGSGAATAVTMPASPFTNEEFIVKDGKGDAATNNITITPAAGTIDGGANTVIATAYGCAGFKYNGTQWNLLSICTNPAPTQRQRPAYGPTVTVNLANGAFVQILASNNTAFTISNPTNPQFDGQLITIQIQNSAGGALGTITWSAQYQLAGSYTSAATANNRSVDFRYDATATKWYEVSRNAADVPN